MQEEKKENGVKEALCAFLNRYLLQRDLPGAMELLSPGFFGVGVEAGEIFDGKESFARALEKKIPSLPQITYSISQWTQRQRSEGCWDCFCLLETRPALSAEGGDGGRLRLTAGFHREKEGYRMDTLHLSQGRKEAQERDFASLQFAARNGEKPPKQDLRERMELIGQVMPGGILGGYLEEGFPLYVANRRFLDMTGYRNFQELKEDIQGLVINSIHPDDRQRVQEKVEGLRWPGDQYELQHRMKKKDGSYLWVYNIGRRTVAVDGQDTIVSVLVDISRQVRIRAYLEREAITDPLTGICNRKGGEAFITEQLGKVGQYLFVMMDLDNFKKVNDMYGHGKGDEVLCAVAGMLRGSFRKTDVVCRLGGDEFAIFASDWEDVSAMEEKLQRLIDDYRAQAEEKWPLAHSTLSIGGVYSNRPLPFQELYQLADEMLYQVKNNGKGQFILRFLE